MELHRAGNLDEARAIYAEVLKQAPRDADAWHFHGLLLHQTGDTVGAIRDVRRALQYAPDYADAIANLAILHLGQREFEECEACLKRVLELTPQALPPRVTLARLYRAYGRLAEGESVLREVLERDLTDAGTEIQSALHASLGETLVLLGRHDEGLAHYRRAIELSPDSTGLQIAIGRALGSIGRFEEAAECYRAILKRDPDDARARHMLAACGGLTTPDRADDAYIRTVFDDFSSSFDQKLASLGYRAPELLQRALQAQLGGACHDLELLDAGCGTGLYGERVRPFCTRLVGVDLSHGMLEIARARGRYDELHEAELASWLQSQASAFDVVASADTLCYFGALEEPVRAAFSALRAGGWLFFSVEHHAEPSSDFLLQHHGRYAHAEPYVGRVLSQAGFDPVLIVHDTLRWEAGNPVAGLIVSARRPTSS
jgi:predicted TPR repeat methyltransferase